MSCEMTVSIQWHPYEWKNCEDGFQEGSVEKWKYISLDK